MTSKLSRRTHAALVAFALLATAFVAPSASGTSSETCVPRPVPGLGNACRLPDGLYKVFLPSGGTVLTHGGDPAPFGAPRSAFETSSWQAFTWPGQVRPTCVTNIGRDFYGHVIYARAKDRPDRAMRLLTELRSMVNVANGIVRREAALFDRRSSLRMRCTGSALTVSRVTLTTTHNQTSFGSVVDDVILQGYSDARVKYWIFYDGHPPGAAAGTATMRPDDSNSAENVNNYGASWAVNFGYRLLNGGPHVWLHEAGHNLGVVQNSAPRSTGAGHCIDGPDTMCYADGGPLAFRYRANYCRTYHFDCGNNDYYNPRPKRGSYLATHWNLGSPVNRFIAGCQFSTGTLVAPGGGAVSDPKITASRGVSRSCWGRPFALSGAEFSHYDALRSAAPSANNLGEFGTWWLGQSPGREVLAFHVPDFSVCFFKGSKQLRCYEKSGTERGSIPSGATKMKIWLAEGVNATYFFNAV